PAPPAHVASAPPAQPASAQPGSASAPAAVPAARAAVRGRLVVIAKSGADGPSYPFGDVLDVGRTEGHIIVGEDPYLSPRHVRLAWSGGRLFLRDLGSTNGVYLRLVPARDMGAAKAGRPAPEPGQASVEVAVPLQDQDLILVGQQVLRFDIVNHGGQGANDGGYGPAAEHGTLLFGSPMASRYARLSQRTVEGVTRDVYYLRKVETVLGRESGDVVFTEDPFLSRRHAAVRQLPHAAQAGQAAAFALVDLGSSNGTFLRIRSDVDLLPGDHFRVGQQLFRVDFERGDPEPGG
ncbi:MAG: domain containing protein, partial [Labilithrix sp.]|nr:domain containing protein [Labilithrix sp.]